MKKYIHNSWKCTGLLLFFSLHVMVIFSMEKQPTSDELLFKPDKIVTIFDLTKKSEKNNLELKEVLPRNIMITPDDKGVVMSCYGKVKYYSFDTPAEGKPKTIIKHHQGVEGFPKVAMGRNKNRVLIASAGNYKNKEQKSVSEYILFRNGWAKRCKLGEPIQAITIDSEEKILAIAGQGSVQVIDLDGICKNGQAYCKKINKDNWITDLVMHPQGKALIAMESSQNGFQWMKIAKETDKLDLFNANQVEIKDKIKKMYYTSDQELLYVTNDAKAKIIKVADLFVDYIDVAKIPVFSDSSSYDMVTADPSGYIATAHWSKSISMVDKIKIYRRCGECIEKFVLLEMPVLTDSGIVEVSRLLDVALYGNHAVALTTHGIMIVWSLPKMKVVSSELDKNDQELLEKIAMPESEKKRSPDKVNKKTSVATIKQMWRNSSGSSSRESSPSRLNKKMSLPLVVIEKKETLSRNNSKRDVKSEKSSHEDDII